MSTLGSWHNRSPNLLGSSIFYDDRMKTRMTHHLLGVLLFHSPEARPSAPQGTILALMEWLCWSISCGGWCGIDAYEQGLLLWTALLSVTIYCPSVSTNAPDFAINKKFYSQIPDSHVSFCGKKSKICFCTPSPYETIPSGWNFNGREVDEWKLGGIKIRCSFQYKGNDHHTTPQLRVTRKAASDLRQLLYSSPRK